MDQATIEEMVRARKIAVDELLMQAPIDGLDEVLTMLRRHLSTEEVCAALTERAAKAPIEDLEALRNVYLKHCRSVS
jgi:hypothetical protein